MGFVFWSMTEARDFHEYAAGPLGTGTVKTEPTLRHCCERRGIPDLAVSIRMGEQASSRENYGIGCCNCPADEIAANTGAHRGAGVSMD